jgi:hypothetical protein
MDAISHFFKVADNQLDIVFHLFCDNIYRIENSFIYVIS